MRESYECRWVPKRKLRVFVFAILLGATLMAPAIAQALTFGSEVPQQLMLGTFWYPEEYWHQGPGWTLHSTRLNSIYGSTNGSDFTRLSYEHLDMADASIMYHDGFFWMITGNMNKFDSKIWPTISCSKDLVHWSTPENNVIIKQGNASYNGISVDTLPDGTWSYNGNDHCFDYVAPEWFVDDDGDVYILLSCGYWGSSHGEATHDRMQPYLIKVDTLSVASVGMSSEITTRYPRQLKFYPETAEKLNVGYARSYPAGTNATGSDNLIDGCIYKENGTYYMVIKRNGLENDVWTTTNIDDPNSWSLQAQTITMGYEAPSLTKLNGTYYLYGDHITNGKGNYTGTNFASNTKGIASTSFWGSPTWWNDNMNWANFRDPTGGSLEARHGTAMTVTESSTTGDSAWSKVASLMYDAQSSNVTRLAGKGALETMQQIVDEGSFTKSGTVIVATKDGYWDALAAAGLAGLNGAPVLLTDTNALSSQTLTELKSLAPTQVYVAGGKAAVSDATMSAIASNLGLDSSKVVRLAGAGATDTAVEIYKQGSKVDPTQGTSWSDTCIVATCDSFQDALSIAPYAYAHHAPIFLTSPKSDVLPQNALDAIRDGKFANVIIVGGTAAVSSTVPTQLTDIGISSDNVRRLAGSGAYDTSLKIATWELENGMSVSTMGLATGEGYWDALTGAALCGKNNSILVLANDAPDHYERLAAFQSLESHIKNGGTKVYVFGGSSVISHYLFNTLETDFES